jgi:hypothetical protein
MIGRSIGYAAAATFSACVLTGIGALIVADLFGEDALSKLWQGASLESARPAVSGSILESIENYTFFKSVEAKEHGISVKTGVAFSTLADLLAGKHRELWCYVQVAPNGGLPRQIGLGAQSGTASPVYADLSGYPKEELAVVGLSARKLHALAKTHCRFAKSSAAPPASTKGGRA